MDELHPNSMFALSVAQAIGHDIKSYVERSGRPLATREGLLRFKVLENCIIMKFELAEPPLFPIDLPSLVHAMNRRFPDSPQYISVIIEDDKTITVETEELMFSTDGILVIDIYRGYPACTKAALRRSRSPIGLYVVDPVTPLGKFIADELSAGG